MIKVTYYAVREPPTAELLRLRQVIRRTVRGALGVEGGIQTEFAWREPEDLDGHDWVLEVEAHATTDRVAAADDLANTIEGPIKRFHAEDVLGAVRLSLSTLGVSYTHGPLGVAVRNFADGA